MSRVVTRTLPAATLGRYLVEPPEHGRPAPMLVGFHGYAENAEAHLAELQRIPGASEYLLVSVQALHRFYTTRTGEVVGCWMTRLDREQAIADNLRYVAAVLEEVRRDHPGNGRLCYAGFSQGVAMAYRAAARGGVPCQGLIVLAGDVPPDVGGDPAALLPPVLIGRGTGDTWYTEPKQAQDVAVLQGRGVTAETLVFEGGHEWTDRFREAAAAFLRRVLGPAP